MTVQVRYHHLFGLALAEQCPGHDLALDIYLLLQMQLKPHIDSLVASCLDYDIAGVASVSTDGANTGRVSLSQVML